VWLAVQRSANQVAPAGAAVAARAVPGSKAAATISAEPPRTRRVARKVSFIGPPFSGQGPTAGACAPAVVGAPPGGSPGGALLSAAAASTGRGSWTTRKPAAVSGG